MQYILFCVWFLGLRLMLSGSIHVLPVLVVHVILFIVCCVVLLCSSVTFLRILLLYEYTTICLSIYLLTDI